MKPDRERAKCIGENLILYNDSIAKNQTEVFDISKLVVILSDTSSEPLAAEQELVMAWRYYTLEREQRIAFGEFRLCSTQEEIEAARCFSAAKTAKYDPINVNGITNIQSIIASIIERDTILDAIKWQVLYTLDEKLIKKIEHNWKPSQLPKMDTEEDAYKRRKYVERSFSFCKSTREHQFRKYYNNRIAREMLKMIVFHRDYWAQNLTIAYDESKLDDILNFSLHGRNHGLYTLALAWDMYLENRIHAHELYKHEPFTAFSEKEKNLNNDEIKNRPIYSLHPDEDAVIVMQTHIKTIIREHIDADISKWLQYKRKSEATKKLALERRENLRLEKINDHRAAFICKVRAKFGQQVLEMISVEDIECYALGIVDRRENEEDLWYSILKNYNFDQNTSSCLYFIRQGSAVKIGITDQLDRRFAQIKTSAAVACKIENVVYTHHGKKLERMLHRFLAPYHSHLEWFVMPKIIEDILFATKSVEDIENAIKNISRIESASLDDEKHN